MGPKTRLKYRLATVSPHKIRVQKVVGSTDMSVLLKKNSARALSCVPNVSTAGEWPMSSLIAVRNPNIRQLAKPRSVERTTRKT